MSIKISSPQKVVVVTGASRGIGYHLALCLAARGYIVCATIRNDENRDEFKKNAKKFPNLYYYKLDVSSSKGVQKCIGNILSRHGKIDVLVNNAAHLLFGPIETISIAQIKEQYDVNVFGAVRLIQAVLPSMRKRKTGHIIFMGSSSSARCPPMYGAYASTKYAIEAIASSLASNLLFWKINVSIIETSATNTEFATKSTKLGNRLLPNDNPYKHYIKNSLRFLQEVLSKGQTPETAAEAIAKIIDKPNSSLRKFITDYAKNIFDEEFKDPQGKQWLKIARDELKWFELE